MSDNEMRADVAVVGGGNAALCAALAAAQGGAGVVLLEAGSEAEAGGNSWFTDGAMRFAFDDFRQLRELLRLSDGECAKIEVPPYPVADYLADLRAAGGTEDELMQTLAGQSRATMQWMRDSGVKLELVYDNQSHETADGKRRFFGNLNVRTHNRGIGLVGGLRDACERAGVVVCYETRARELIMQGGKCKGVVAEGENGKRLFYADAVVLACGGFEANETMRAEHLGEEWKHARVRGTKHNNGDGIQMALAAGAAKAGDWKGCHAVGTDFNSPLAGDFSLPGDIWKKHSYPYGIMVNNKGLRFVDEGADLRNYTYAKYGREVLRQPGAKAWQIFDSKTEPLLRSEYRHERVAVLRANTPQELAAQMGIDREQFLKTLRDYNNAARESKTKFNPALKDGKSARGLAVEKSHWALPVCEPPLMAFAITCGITFTFGGVKADAAARVLTSTGEAIGGLFAAGEMIGGIFASNYPGGSGLMSGAVFGRIAGVSAARARAGG